jgi:hypothetical protein
VDFLKAPHADGIAGAGGDSLGGGSGAAHGGDVQDAVHHGAAADGSQPFARVLDFV